MNRIPVKCTLLKSVGYDPESRILGIKFIDNEIREYYHVPDYIHQNLMESDRKRAYYLSNIKNVYKDKIVSQKK